MAARDGERGDARACEPCRAGTAANLIGRYQIDGVVGEGGMGVVYAGWDPDLQRRVAIKVLGDAMVGTGRTRLLREARAMAKLSHPNVITVFEVAHHEGRDFIAMELVDGVNLAEWLRADHPRPEVLRVFLEAGRGLAAAHAAGMIHRDFKPHNVLVRRDGRALVTDFGLARLERADRPPAPPLTDVAVAALVDAVARADDPAPAQATAAEDRASATTAIDPGDGDPARSPTLVDPRSSTDTLTRTGTLLGTPGYMAPEQYRGTADARSDQFAYCAALWQGLTGALPFRGATRTDLVDAIEREPTGELTGKLRAILARGLAPDPRERWPSMDALLRALEPRRRHAWWIGGAAAVAVTAIIGVAAVYAVTRDSPAAVIPAEATAAPPVLPRGGVHHLTLDDGCEEFPSFTPDGKTVVYDGLVGHDYAIMTLDVATGRTRRVTSGEHWDFKAAASPDGRSVAFLRREPTGESTYVIALDGGAARRIGRGGLQPIWAAAGDALWIGRDETAELVSLDSGAILRTVRSPEHERPQEGVVLPDGRLALLMFPLQGDQTATGVAVYGTDGRPHRLLDSMLLEAIAVAPDGKALLVAHISEAGTRELWRAPLDGTLPSAVPGPAQPTYGIAVSPRGDRIAWSDCEPKTRLAMVSADLASLTPLPSGTWTDQAPAAVPKSQRIVVASDRDRTLRLWVIDLTRNEPARALPSGDREVGAAAVSIDGQTVYAVDDAEVLVAQPIDGSRPGRRIAEHVSGTPAPRRDGSIAFTVAGPDGARLDLVPAGGGAPSTLAPAASVPAASPVGDDLYYISSATGDEGHIMHRDGAGRIRRLSRELAVRPWRALTVSGDGKRIAAIDSTKIMVVEVSSGHVVGSYEAGADMLTGATWVGATLLVSYVEFQGDLWLLGS